MNLFETTKTYDIPVYIELYPDTSICSIVSNNKSTLIDGNKLWQIRNSVNSDEEFLLKLQEIVEKRG